VDELGDGGVDGDGHGDDGPDRVDTPHVHRNGLSFTGTSEPSRRRNTSNAGTANAGQQPFVVVNHIIRAD
jgi:hypothetical protein